MLLARHAERTRLDQLLEGIRADRSRALVIHGDSGVGKTTMLGYLVEQAVGCRVIRVVGIQSEIELPYAALHQLCRPLMEGVDRLPAPQRDALATTFGLQPGPFPQRFMIALAALSLLAESASDRPLVCVVDDAQWLDKESAQVLSFVARRLESESVGIVFAVRGPSSAAGLEGLPEVALSGLGDEEAHALLASIVSGPLDSRALNRIIAETGGNPLAIVESARSLTRAEIATGIVLPALLRATDVEREFERRASELPPETRQLLLIAAAEPFADSLLVRGAAAGLGITPDALIPAIAAGLCAPGTVVRFSHPLVRSGVYRAAGPQERRDAHRALAEVTRADLDPDRHAWHVARAAVGIDEDAALGLARAAERVMARGGPAAAAALLREAVELTAQPEQRVQWWLDIARAEMLAGDFEAALSALASARGAPLSESRSAIAALVEAQISFAVDHSNRASPLLVSAADVLAPLDPGLARETYLEAFSAALVAGRLARGVDIREVARRAEAAHLPPGQDSQELLLTGLVALWGRGRLEAVEPMREALDAFVAGKLAGSREVRWLWLAAITSIIMWEDSAWDVLSARHLEITRETGDVAELPLALTSRVFTLLFAGEVAAASLLVDEANTVMEATSRRMAPYAAIGLAAWQGDEREVHVLLGTLGSVTDRGEASGAGLIHWSAALMHNGHGRYEEAYHEAVAARAYFQEFDAGTVWTAIELIEAATRTDRHEEAPGEFRVVADSAEASGTDWALGVRARCEALLRSGEEAEAAYRESIARLRNTRCKAELARAHLLFGEWLRRERRTRDARIHLRTAHQAFTAMGMRAFGARTARELRAAGSPIRATAEDNRNRNLTRQEDQIAHLARAGLSNPEIATRLFLSPRTVEYHLHKVFTKLGINSRAQLITGTPGAPH